MAGNSEAALALHDLYAKKLLEPGWAGEVDDAEAAFIADKLTRRPTLRRLWQVARFTRRRKAITPTIAKRLCRWWAEMPATGDGAELSDMVKPKTRRRMRKPYPRGSGHPMSEGGKQGLFTMSRAANKTIMRLLAELSNEETRGHFLCLGDSKRVYARPQRDYALTLIDTYGVRATSRILGIPRRTIQRWCRRYGKRVGRCPTWVYDWAERRRKRQEFWERRGYY